MPITVEKAVKINSAIEKFFKAIGRAERIRNRINRLAEENYKTFLPKVRAWMEFTNKEINKAFSRKYIRKSVDGKIEYYAWVDFQKDKAIDITTKLLDWEKLDEAGKRMLKPAGLDIMAKSGDEAYKIAGIEASFDILNPEAVKAVDRICSKAVKEVGKETKQAINHIIREGIKEGKSMGKIAKELRPLVGLTERQVKAVKNYEKWLIKKRPDLSDFKRTEWVKRYNKKLHRYRTDMIARTESMRATNEGNLIGYKEAGYATVRWSANVGACPQCDAESGHVYTIEESRGMLPAHPDCRCSWLPESKVKPKVPKVPKPVVPKVPKWKPTMTAKEADLWAKGSQYEDDVFYHGTTDKSAAKIKLDGFKLEKLGKQMGNGGLGGAGHYVSPDSSYARVFALGKEGELLKIKTNVKNILKSGSKTQKVLQEKAFSLTEAVNSLGDITLKEAQEKALFGRVREALKKITEKEWKEIKLIMDKQKFGAEMVQRYVYKQEGYDAIDWGVEKVIFDDKSLIVLK